METLIINYIPNWLYIFSTFLPEDVKFNEHWTFYSYIDHEPCTYCQKMSTLELFPWMELAYSLTLKEDQELERWCQSWLRRGLETKSCYLKCVSRFLGDLQDLIAEQERRSKQCRSSLTFKLLTWLIHMCKCTPMQVPNKMEKASSSTHIAASKIGEQKLSRDIISWIHKQQIHDHALKVPNKLSQR